MTKKDSDKKKLQKVNKRFHKVTSTCKCGCSCGCR